MPASGTTAACYCLEDWTNGRYSRSASTRITKNPAPTAMNSSLFDLTPSSPRLIRAHTHHGLGHRTLERHSRLLLDSPRRRRPAAAGVTGRHRDGRSDACGTGRSSPSARTTPSPPLPHRRWGLSVISSPPLCSTASASGDRSGSAETPCSASPRRFAGSWVSGALLVELPLRPQGFVAGRDRRGPALVAPERGNAIGVESATVRS